ncbi:MAG: phage tail assembly protein [Clostridiaceae bacterium]
MNKLKLNKPVDIDGVSKTQIDYDLEDLSGRVIENAMKAMQKDGYVPTVQEVDPILHAHIFAEAAGIDYEDVKRFNVKDFQKAVGIVRDFFLSSSEDSSQENISE